MIQQKKNIIKYNTKGITIISLVITIIVLLILTGVSIGLIFNSEELFNKVITSTSKYNELKQNEIDYLAEVMNDIDKYNEISQGGSSGIASVTPEPTKQPSTEIQIETTSQTALDGKWWIPKGFQESEETKDKTIKEGKVIKDKAGNEWVWIPCFLDDNGTNKGQQQYSLATEYKRTDFGKQYGSFSDYYENLDNKDSMSIKKYGGFYIGRYEAGGDNEKPVVAEDTTRKLLIKRYVQPYNYISYEDLEIKSLEFAKDNEYYEDKVYTKLVSSYAWDTTLCFIQNTITDYATNSPQGNYENHKCKLKK